MTILLTQLSYKKVEFTKVLFPRGVVIVSHYYRDRNPLKIVVSLNLNQSKPVCLTLEDVLRVSLVSNVYILYNF